MNHIILFQAIFYIRCWDPARDSGVNDDFVANWNCNNKNDTRSLHLWRSKRRKKNWSAHKKASELYNLEYKHTCTCTQTARTEEKYKLKKREPRKKNTIVRHWHWWIWNEKNRESEKMGKTGKIYMEAAAAAAESWGNKKKPKMSYD